MINNFFSNHQQNSPTFHMLHTKISALFLKADQDLRECG